MSFFITSRRYPAIFLISSSIINKLISSRIAPKYPLAARISPAIKNATRAAKTGSREKITPAWEALVYFWAIVCTTKENPVQKMDKVKIENQTFPEQGK